MTNDSCYAKGLSIVESKSPFNTKIKNIAGRDYKILKYLNDAEGLTLSVLANLLGCSRKNANKTVLKLWESSLVRCISIATTKDIFKIWVTSNKKPPRNANEACRLAALGLYYGRARAEVPGFEWRVLHTPKKSIHAEMTYTVGEGKEKRKLIIDAPRRGEEPNLEADIYIFPTIEEGKELVPKGKRFTSDVTMLLEKNVELKNLIFELGSDSKQGLHLPGVPTR